MWAGASARLKPVDNFTRSFTRMHHRPISILVCWYGQLTTSSGTTLTSVWQGITRRTTSSCRCFPSFHGRKAAVDPSNHQPGHLRASSFIPEGEGAIIQWGMVTIHHGRMFEPYSWKPVASSPPPCKAEAPKQKDAPRPRDSSGPKSWCRRALAFFF